MQNWELQDTVLRDQNSAGPMLGGDTLCTARSWHTGIGVPIRLVATCLGQLE